MTAACCCPCVVNCVVVAVRFATAIGGSFIKVCGPVGAGVIAWLFGATTGTPGTVPFGCGGNSGETKVYPGAPRSGGSIRLTMTERNEGEREEKNAKRKLNIFYDGFKRIFIERQSSRINKIDIYILQVVVGNGRDSINILWWKDSLSWMYIISMIRETHSWNWEKKSFIVQYKFRLWVDFTTEYRLLLRCCGWKFFFSLFAFNFIFSCCIIPSACTCISDNKQKKTD